MDANLQYTQLSNAQPQVEQVLGVRADQETNGGTGGGHGGQEGVLLVQQEGMVQGPSGEQYVTIIQDGQAYALPAADYAAMISQQNIDFNSKEEPKNVSNPNTIPVSTKGEKPKPTGTSQNKNTNVKSNQQLHAVKSTKTQSVVPAVVSAVSTASNNLANSKHVGQSKLQPKPKEAPKKSLYPTIQEVIQKLPESTTTPRKNYKPIRVDNWGIFLLSRLQAYFQQKEYCDLTLRFPSKNAQIKVHKLILNACTDYFSNFENEGKIKDNALDMPANFTPEAVAPIIRFMYTGKIELKESSYEKLYKTAETLQMNVLIKLMDAQVNAPESEHHDKKSPVKRQNSGAFEDDPVEQIRKIRRIEKKVALEEKKAAHVIDGPRLPGKKLRIWKRKVPTQNHLSTKNVTDNSNSDSLETNLPSGKILQGYKIPKVAEDTGSAKEIMNKSIEKAREEDDDRTRHIKIEPLSGQLIASPIVGTTYKRRSPGEKPKIPRRLQEINQHLMFEKVLKSGTKNTVMKKDQVSDKSGEMSMEEVKELMEEQKQRSATISQEDLDENEEYDYNDDSLGIGDDYIDNVDSPAPENLCDEDSDLNLDTKSLPSVMAEPEPQKKTIKFNLQATSEAHLPKKFEKSQFVAPIATAEIQKNLPSEGNNEVLSIVSKKTSTNDDDFELDEALEEFSRVAEEEAAELNSNEESQIDPPPIVNYKSGIKQQITGKVTMDPKKPRRGRPPRWLKEQTLQMGAQARMGLEPVASSSIDLKPPAYESENKALKPETSCVSNQDQGQNQLINEVMKKYPNLFKENKAVKVKILTKDISGKTVTKFITLKGQKEEPQPLSQPESPVSPVPVAVGGFKPVQKVMYTGKRGRPKKVKPGDFDPHLEERKKIEARLQKEFPQLASQLACKKETNIHEYENVSQQMEIQNQNFPEPPSDQQASNDLKVHTVPVVKNLISSGESGSLGNLPTGLDIPVNQPAEEVIHSQEITTNVAQYQPNQTYVLDNGQFQIVTQGSQFFNIEQSQVSTNDIIQLVTSDGQIQYALPKHKLGNINNQSLALLNHTQTVNPAGLVSLNAGRNISTSQVLTVNAASSLSSNMVMAPGMMTLTPAPPPPYNTLSVPSTSSILLSEPKEILQTMPHTSQTNFVHNPVNSVEGPKGVNKIVSDWDSDEEKHD